MKFSTSAVAMLVMLGLCSATLYAQQISQHIFGIELGKPLNVEPCTSEDHMSQKHPPCINEGSLGEKTDLNLANSWIQFSWGELPEWVVYSAFKASTLDGAVERIWIVTKGPDRESRILSDLTAKFGKPTRSSRLTINAATGAPQNSLVATWNLKDITAKYQSHVSGGKGTITVETRKGAIAYEEYLKSTPRPRAM